MAKVRLDPNQLPPMPVALVGTLVEGRVNFMAAAWITRVLDGQLPVPEPIALQVQHIVQLAHSA